MGSNERAQEILTIGHSNRSAEKFIELVASHDIELIADVRAHPGSRRLPHFGSVALAVRLDEADVEYLHVPELGGRRRPLPDSANGGWEHDSFRGYADHMASAEFERGMERLEGAARERRAAVMCAEALWWKCHRRLVADALSVRGWSVRHVLGPARADPHSLTPFAVVRGDRIAYPAPQLAIDS